MFRLTCGFVVASSLIVSVAQAESQAEIAARLNDEGKQFLAVKNYASAAEKFQDAHSRVPEPKYFYNHGLALAALGKYGEALVACNAAEKNAEPKLKDKVAELRLK